MTKQQPCASKLRLSKLCQWLIALGIVKLALFGAWAVDMPMPQLVFPGKEAASVPAPSATANAPAQPQEDSSAASVLQSGEVRLAALFAGLKESVATKATPAEAPAPPAESPRSPAQADTNLVTAPDEPAVRSAAPLPAMPVVHLPWSRAARAEAEAATEAGADIGERPLASGVDADVTAAPVARATAVDNSWWREILTLTRLPVPVLGAQRTAHASALDMPAPARRPATGASPFTPPEQAQVLPGTPAPGGQASSEPPLPLRPRPNTPQDGTGAAPVPTIRSSPSAASPELKQQELARREQDVLMLKQQMESRLQELQTTEKKVQGMLKEAHGVHDQKIKHLISSYTNMKPKQAALALESLDERLAVRILAGMNPKQAGEVLTYTNPKTVAKLTELLARMQLPWE